MATKERLSEGSFILWQLEEQPFNSDRQNTLDLAITDLQINRKKKLYIMNI